MMNHSAENPARDWFERLQTSGYRLTRPRRAVVEIIAGSQYALSPLDVFELARSRHPRLGLVTVYRTLEKLEELMLIQRVHRPSGCQAFIAARAGHQHLLICQSCGRAAYFSGDGEWVDQLMSKVGDELGYAVEAHWLQLFGICEHCR